MRVWVVVNRATGIGRIPVNQNQVEFAIPFMHQVARVLSLFQGGKTAPILLSWPENIFTGKGLIEWLKINLMSSLNMHWRSYRREGSILRKEKAHWRSMQSYLGSLNVFLAHWHLYAINYTALVFHPLLRMDNIDLDYKKKLLEGKQRSIFFSEPQVLHISYCLKMITTYL